MTRPVEFGNMVQVMTNDSAHVMTNVLKNLCRVPGERLDTPVGYLLHAGCAVNDKPYIMRFAKSRTSRSEFDPR